MPRPIAVLMIWCSASILTLAQNDTIISHSGDVLIGEIKSMAKGVLTFETDYSDKDFQIEWSKIATLASHRTYLMYLTDGRRLNGSIMSLSGDPPMVLLSTSAGILIIESLLDIIYLKPVESNFLGRLDASFELGYSYTKARNHHQFNTRSNIGYLANRWGADAGLDIIRSRQDSVAPTRRTDGTIGFRVFLKHSWYLSLSNNFLQNDEQKLKLRSTTNLSAGYLIFNTHKTYWTAGPGLAYTYENFTNELPTERSMEGLLITELNLYAHDDLSLLTTLKMYPGITVRGRFRSDFRFDLKYDLPLDFFIKLGFTHNFDNKPVEGASRHDYVIQTTVGWEL